MKKISLMIIILFGIKQSAIAQKGTLYLLMDKPFFQYPTIENILTGFVIDSKDKRFVCDYYKFYVYNIHYSEKAKDIIFLPIKDLRKEVKIDTIQYETISTISKGKKWWKLHEELSLKKKIYLLEKLENNINPKTKITDYKYYVIPLIYEGTAKNTIPTDLSFKKE